VTKASSSGPVMSCDGAMCDCHLMHSELGWCSCHGQQQHQQQRQQQQKQQPPSPQPPQQAMCQVVGSCDQHPLLVHV
jgi:hypothetical protein